MNNVEVSRTRLASLSIVVSALLSTASVGAVDVVKAVDPVAEPVDPVAAVIDVIDKGGSVALVPGRALIKLKDIDDANTVFFSKTGGLEAEALAGIERRQQVRLSLVRPSLFGWVLVDVRDAQDGVDADGNKDVVHADVLPTEKQTTDLLARLARDPAMDVVSPEKWMRPLRTPNDPSLAQMWHLDQIGAKQAWDRTVGTSAQRVGVIDTGLVRAHPEFAGRVVGGFDFIASSSASNDGGGRDADFNDAGDACNGSGNSFHGTHVAGTIGAATNNGSGIAGMNWNAGLMIARALGRCGGSSVDIMEAAAWLAGARINGVPDVGANKVSVMNLSLGSAGRCSSFEQQTVSFVNNQGVVMVVAAGNDGGAIGSPANCNGTVSVGAVGPTNVRTRYSSFGSALSVMAPGGDVSFGNGGGVLSTVGQNGLSFQQGTSMAAPHVAGAISLIQALQPGATRTSIVNLLRSTGAACGNCQGIPAIRIGAALASLGGGTTTPPPPTSPPPPTNTGDDPWEENDTAATATVAACGVNEGRLIAAAGDQDWFVFTPPQGQRITIDLAGGQPDLDLYIVDDSGRNILARSEGSTGVERISGNASGRRLRVLVNPYVDQQRGVSHSGPYRLTIRCGAAATTQAATGDEDVGDDEDVFTGGAFDEPALGDATDELAVPEEGPEVEDEVIDSAANDDVNLGAVSASGGCSAATAAPAGVAPLAVVAFGLLLRRRRR